MTHISLELAKWLKGRGCKIESKTWWGTVWTKPGEIGWNIVDRPDGDGARAYSWYDLLVTHAKEFWGEEEICGDCGRTLRPAVFHRGNDAIDGFRCDCGFQAQPFFTNCYEHHTSELLQLLQQNKIQEAELYVRKYSVFADQIL